MRGAVIVAAVAAVAAVVALLGVALTPPAVVRDGGVQAPRPVAVINIKYRVDVVTRVARLGSDLAIGPGTLDAEIDLGNGTITGDLWLPPAYGYFIVFGFVPNTARVDLVPVGKVTGVIKDGNVTANAKVDITVGEVAVDRQPLDVGRACRTVEPASIDLTGPFDLNLIPMRGVYTIPSFAGCVGRERLDPLITGLISGPDNTIDVKLTALPSVRATP